MLLSVAVLSTAAAADKRPLLEDYKGQDPVPDELYETYAAFVKAMKSANRERIQKFFLYNMEITTTPRRGIL